MKLSVNTVLAALAVVFVICVPACEKKAENAAAESVESSRESPPPPPEMATPATELRDFVSGATVAKKIVAKELDVEKLADPAHCIPVLLGALAADGDFLLITGDKGADTNTQELGLATIQRVFGELTAKLLPQSAPATSSPAADGDPVAAWAAKCEATAAALTGESRQLFEWGRLTSGMRDALFFRKTVSSGAGQQSADTSALTEKIETWKTERLTPAAMDALSAAFAFNKERTQTDRLALHVMHGMEALEGLASLDSASNAIYEDLGRPLHDLILCFKDSDGVWDGPKIPVAPAVDVPGTPSDSTGAAAQVRTTAPTGKNDVLTEARRLIEGRDVEGNLVFPDPLDRVMQINTVMPEGVLPKEFWKKYLRKYRQAVNPDDYGDKNVAVPLIFGIRVSDGFFAVVCEDANELRKVAEDLKALGKKIGAKDADLNRAEAIPRLAENGQWSKVVTELSRLREDVLNVLNRNFPKNKALVMMGAWLQGAAYVCPAIEECIQHHKGRGRDVSRLSSILREPGIVAFSIDGILKLEKTQLEHPQVLDGLRILNFAMVAVDVPARHAVPSDKVAELGKRSEAYVKACVGGLKAKKDK